MIKSEISSIKNGSLTIFAKLYWIVDFSRKYSITLFFHSSENCVTVDAKVT